MVRVKGREEAIPGSPVVSLLNLLQRAGVPIETVCGGRAQCGRCRLRVLQGWRMMSPPNEAERRRLEALGAGADERLACQSYTRGDIEIEVLNPRPSG
jgi:adenylate cyclase